MSPERDAGAVLGPIRTSTGVEKLRTPTCVTRALARAAVTNVNDALDQGDAEALSALGIGRAS